MDPGDRLVVAQAATLAGLAWPGRARWLLPRSVRRLAAAAVVVGGAFAAVGARPHGPHLTPRTTPPDEATLLTTGPYAFSRNPIYAGLLVASTGAAVLRRRPEPLLACAGLWAVLTAKVRHEEGRLAARFGPAYEDYRRRTPRFVGPLG